MRSVAMDVFAMPEVTVEGEIYDCVILALDRHSGYIVAVLAGSPRRRTRRTSMEWGCRPRPSPTP